METLSHASIALVWPSNLLLRPPERRHGYEQQYHSISAQSEHEPLEAKRPRMETVAEAHIIRTPPTAGGLVLPITHTVQDSLRATVEVKKVSPLSCVHAYVCVLKIELDSYFPSEQLNKNKDRYLLPGPDGRIQLTPPAFAL